MNSHPTPSPNPPPADWVALREELTTVNLQRMWWLLLTSTAISLGFALLNLLEVQDTRFVFWQGLDLGGSVLFLILFWLGRNRLLSPRLRWWLCPAYFAFWMILMDGYYFNALPRYGETVTYALGAIVPAVVILLPPRLFLGLLLPNHVIFCALQFTREAGTESPFDGPVFGALTNGSIGVLVASLAAWFLFAAKRDNFHHERMILARTIQTRQTASHLRAILENIPFQAWLKNAHGSFLAVNGEFIKGSGLKREEIIGRSLSEIYPPERAATYQNEDDDIMAKRRKVDFVESLDAPEGRKWFEVFKSPVIDDTGHVLGTAGLARDVTERKEMEQRLHAADQAKSDFLAAMSHEIRTPMNSVLGYADLLLQMPLQPQQRDYVESIATSGQLLLAVINDILDFSKIEAGKITLQEEPVRLRELILQIKRMFEPLAVRKNLHTQIAVADNVPELVQGDFHRIEQILVNLLSNAIKFTDKGGVELRVTALPSEGDEGHPEIRFAVSDTGIGISAEQLQNLFQPFHQIDATIARQFSGTGLGLVISRRLCEQMRGTIEVQSQPRQGSTFTASVRLPVLSADPDTMAAADPKTVLAPASSLPLRILLVEDNALNRRLVTAILKRWNLSADTAASGPQAVQAAQEVAYDVILMDVQMPGMDGFEVTAKIRAWEKAHPDRLPSRIVALTALAMVDDRARCLEAGMDEYLSKPISPEALRRMLLK